MTARTGARPLAAAVLAVAALALAAGGDSHRAAAPVPGRGPVVIYLVDTLRFDRMSAYGARRDTTPAALRLAAEGVRYDVAYSVATWTRPAVASLLTSRPPAEVEAIERTGVLARGVPTIAELFRGAGWETAAFSGNPNVFSPGLGFERGFDTFDGVKTPPSELPPGDAVADRAIRWIDGRTSGRFLLFVHVVDPHAPYDHFLPRYRGMFPTAPGDEGRRLSEYDGLVRQADDQFARLRAALERKGFWKDALVVYLSDHGEQFFEHGGQFHGDTLFEETLRIPLIVRGSGWGDAGERIAAPASILDLLPSIAHWAGLPADPRWAGRAIDRDPPEERELYASEELDGARLYALRRGSRKVIVSLNPPFRIEFDLARDPGEQAPRDAGDDLVRRVERLRAREIMYYGGLWIRRNGAEPLRLFGTVRGVDPVVPFLLWTDRERIPSDLARPDVLELDRRIAAGEPFQLRLTRFGYGAKLPEASLTVEHGGMADPVVADALPGAPVEISRRAMTTLSEQQQAEIVRKMRALGYLGGN